MEDATGFFDALVRERSAYNRLLGKQLLAAAVVTFLVPLMSFFVALSMALRDDSTPYKNELSSETMLRTADLATSNLPSSDIALPLLAITATIVVVIALQNRSGARRSATGEVAGTVLSTSASLAGFLTSLASGLWIVASVNAIAFDEQIARIGDATIATLVMSAGAALAALSRNGLDVYAVSVTRVADRLKRVVDWRFPLRHVDTAVAVGAAAAFVNLVMSRALAVCCGAILTAPIEYAGAAVAVAGLVGLLWSWCVSRLVVAMPPQDGSLLDLLDDTIPVPPSLLLIPLGTCVMLVLTGGLLLGPFTGPSTVVISISMVLGATTLGLLWARARFIDRAADGRLDRELGERAVLERQALSSSLDELAAEDEALGGVARKEYEWLMTGRLPRFADRIDV